MRRRVRGENSQHWLGRRSPLHITTINLASGVVQLARGTHGRPILFDHPKRHACQLLIRFILSLLQHDTPKQRHSIQFTCIKPFQHDNLFIYLAGRRVTIKLISGAARGPPGEQRWPHQPAARKGGKGQKVKGRRRGHYGFGDGPGSRGGNVRRCRGRQCSSPGRLARAQHQYDGGSFPVGWSDRCAAESRSLRRRAEAGSLQRGWAFGQPLARARGAGASPTIALATGGPADDCAG